MATLSREPGTAQRQAETLQSAPVNTAFRQFGPLKPQKMGPGPKIASTILVTCFLTFLFIVTALHPKVVQRVVQQTELVFTPDITPPPPPPHIKIPPPPPIEQKAPPKIELKMEQPKVAPPQIHMNIPQPVVVAAPPRKVTPPPAPKMLALNVAPAAVPNHNTRTTAVSLGDPNALRPVPNAKPAPSAVSLGVPGMPARNNGQGAAGAKSLSLGSGDPYGSAGGRDRGRAVAGVSLGVTGGTGSGPVRSNSPVTIAGVGVATGGGPSRPSISSAAATTPVTITYSPRGQYTAQAEAAHVSGTVDVEVIFHANGSIQVVRVVRGLGYGLDQNALAAASAIRFRPATQNGQPIDQHTIVHIQFQSIS